MVDTAGKKSLEKDTGTPTDDSDVEATQCHFCGTYTKNGYEYDVDAFDAEGNRKRHYLSDCRPDLVEHEIGDTCTWPVHPEMGEEWNKEHGRPGCYAYQDRETLKWTKDHVHFFPDGPL